MKRKLFTVQQIDGMTAIKTPHERELSTIGDSVLQFLPEIVPGRLKEAIEGKMGGIVEDLGMGEDFTMTFEYFPEVLAHIQYLGPEEDEDDLFSEPEVQFYFSGDRVLMVSSEDLASLIDLTMDYLEDILEEARHDGARESESDLLARSLGQREGSFSLLSKGAAGEMATFCGASLASTEGESWEIEKQFFPGIVVSLKYDGVSTLTTSFSGDAARAINDYAKDQMAIFLMNHCLRHIALASSGTKFPEIVKKAFSFSYLKEHD